MLDFPRQLVREWVRIATIEDGDNLRIAFLQYTSKKQSKTNSSVKVVRKSVGSFFEEIAQSNFVAMKLTILVMFITNFPGLLIKNFKKQRGDNLHNS